MRNDRQVPGGRGARLLRWVEHLLLIAGTAMLVLCAALVAAAVRPRVRPVDTGHLENTAFPGEPGNVVIAGHRDSFFWPLQNIHLGDDIFLDTRDGPWQYRVTAVRVVNPRDVSVLWSGRVMRGRFDRSR